MELTMAGALNAALRDAMREDRQDQPLDVRRGGVFHLFNL